MLPPMPMLTVMVLTVSTISLRRQMAHNSYVNRATPANGTRYDYIVVGAGNAGCVVARRLAENNPNITVLLLEAGGPQSIVTDMPGNTAYLIGGDFDWNFQAARQQNAGRAYNTFSLNRGKVLGGSSTVSWDIYNRGNPNDYNNWANQYGLTNLSWPNVLEYFLLYENNTDSSYLSYGYHRSNGLVSIATETMPDPVLVSLRKSMNQAGIPTIDLNGPTQAGTAIAQMFWNIDTAIKSTSANAYIESTNLTNIIILSRAQVDRVLLANSSYASGVVYNKNGSQYVAYANREVILSAGSINTPQVLMLSGIGPTAHLMAANISPVLNLPVGSNFHDMIFVPLYYKINNSSLIDSPPEYNIGNMYDYYTNASGTLAHHADSVTYYNTSLNSNGSSWPDTMIVSIVEYMGTLNATVSQYRDNQAEWRKFWGPFSELGYYLAIDPVLARPRSRGTVRLNVTNPREQPIIDPNYLSDQNDLDRLVEVTRFAINAMRKYPVKGLSEALLIPSCPYLCSFGDYCDEYLRCYIRSLTRSYYSQVGSARMGLTNDSSAVVDPNFKVIGFDNLRVVDASVIPEIPNAHPEAAVYMLAEKASRLILADSM